jgi:serine/threonine protein kinase
MRHGSDPVLNDFELSRDVGSGASTRTLTANLPLAGTLEYMAPEQLEEGRRGGLEADMWALGVLLLKVW